MASTNEMTIKSKNSSEKIHRMIPKNLQKKDYITKTAFAYLKVGGPKLAKQSIKAFAIAEKLENIRIKENIYNETFFENMEKKHQKNSKAQTEIKDSNF